MEESRNTPLKDWLIPIGRHPHPLHACRQTIWKVGAYKFTDAVEDVYGWKFTSVVTVIPLGLSGSVEMSMRYPRGRKMLKRWMRYGFPWNNVVTSRMTPGVSTLRCKLAKGKQRHANKNVIDYTFTSDTRRRIAIRSAQRLRNSKRKIVTESCPDREIQTGKRALTLDSWNPSRGPRNGYTPLVVPETAAW